MKKRIVFIMAAIIVGLACVLPFSSLTTARAADTALEYDKTNALDDLRSSTVNGQAFNLADYPYTGYYGDTPQLINFVEYCYNYRADKQDNYGLYLYIYNPGGWDFNTTTLSNMVQLAVSYNADGNPEDYQKFRLTFLNHSTETKYKRLFYKFKISDTSSILARVKNSERSYDISGIELVTQGANNATEYKVGCTYKFTGYSSGYGQNVNAVSNLQPDVTKIETIELNVKKTYFRTGLSNKGIDHQNQLDTVYFSVDNDIINEYGKLQRIKAEWYEYRTKPIAVTSLLDFSTKVRPYIGDVLSSYNSTLDYGLYYNLKFEPSTNRRQFDWAYNATYISPAWSNKIDSSLYYIFYKDDISSYDPRQDKRIVGGVESNELYEYILNYNKSFRKGALPIKDGNISADLFEDNIDSERIKDTEFGKVQRGYSYYDFDADIDLQQMFSYNTGGYGFWDKANDFGFWKTVFGDLPDLDEQYTDIVPIYPIDLPSDLLGTDDEISRRLLINKADVKALKDVCGSRGDKTTFLFRFAVTDYFSGQTAIWKETGSGQRGWYDQAYIAQETVFFDFDIIQLTFSKKGIYHVIPVVSSPIDIVNDITPPLVWDEVGGCAGGISIVLILALIATAVTLAIRQN